MRYLAMALNRLALEVGRVLSRIVVKKGSLPDTHVQSLRNVEERLMG